MKIIFPFFFLLITNLLKAQSIAINTDGSLADTSAILDVKSYTKGVLVPRMNSAQRAAIILPSHGLLVYDISTSSFWCYNGSVWVELRGVGATNFWLPHANGLYYNSGKIGIGTTPEPIVPLSVFLPNTGVGNSIALFQSNDTWHSAIGIRSNINNRQFALVVGGPSNLELKPNNFGILNTNLIRWSMVVNGANNFVGFGSADIHTPIPKSTVHILSGDINIEQIGSGIIMKSPDGQCWRVTIDNTGNFVRSAIACP